MEKYTKAVEKKVDSLLNETLSNIKRTLKREAEKLHESENETHKQKEIDLERKNASLCTAIAAQKIKLEDHQKAIKSLQDINQRQKSGIDIIHKKLEDQVLKIDILKAEKKTLDARVNELQLKLRQQQQRTSHCETTIVGTSPSTAPQSGQVRNLKRFRAPKS